MLCGANISVLLLCVCILAHSVDARTPSSLVAVEEGQLRGTCDARGVCQYLGIPFAAPPIGHLRWKPPQPPHNWQGVRDATQYGSPCVQLAGVVPNVSKPLVGDESCLFLNVWTPPAGGCRRASCPVMFWIHGGAFISGAGSQYDSSNLVAYAGDVVVVTTNYRLGVLGFLGSEALRGRDASGGSTGNYGIQDQRAALQWVRRNIHGFGGDAGNVMIFGESAGGGSVSMHLTMQRSWPLYHKAAIESGAYSYWTAQPMRQAEQLYQDLLNASGCGAQGLPCLATLDVSKLARTAMLGLPARARPYGCQFAPTVDGVELKKLPWELRDEGHFNTQVPVLAGYNKDEGTIGVDFSPLSKIYEKVAGMTAGDFARLVTELQYNATPADLPAILDVYSVNRSGGDPDYTSWYWAATHFSGDYAFSCPTRRAARAISRHGRSRLFLYYFAHESRAAPFDFAGVKGVNHTAGASHASEIEFVFLLEDPHGQLPHLIGEDEKLLARTMAAYWINFARTSDPNTAGEKRPAQRTSLTIPWEPFTPERQVSVRLDLPHLSDAVGRNDPQCDLMDRLGVLAPPMPAVPMMTVRSLGHAGLLDASTPGSMLLI
mmetsp:Transcript_43852/g.136523  ORF Transcript_43852/g.136523 Transcript_43852/m.136523 type:complete len:602 (+) Transcript_43852:87-1892(+)